MIGYHCFQMRDEMIRKLEAELQQHIETERQVVYIVVEIRKLMDRDNLPKDQYKQLRLFCSWAAHAELSNSVVKEKLMFLNSVAREIVTHKLTDQQKQRCSEMLGLQSARAEFLEFIRAYKMNRSLQAVFTPVWWGSFLRQYIQVVSDCPLVLEGKGIRARFIKKATIVGCEITDSEVLGDRFEFIFEIKWIVEFMNGLRYEIPVPLGIEKADHGFGRTGRTAVPTE